MPRVKLLFCVDALLNAIAGVHAALANRLKRVPSRLSGILKVIKFTGSRMVLDSLFQFLACLIKSLLCRLLCYGHLGLKLADVVYKCGNGSCAVVEEQARAFL
jgi:hypothetical protein